tara:strand:+ start:164 stop:742 length:579 start_codon:yes stop_codon:yes gene_type:complete
MNINFFDFNSRINLKKGYLLLAQPLLIDSYFSRSVILICDHNKNGTIGLQINKPLKSKVESIISKPLIDQKVFLGGPVDKNIFFLHKKNVFTNDSVKINNHLFFSKNIDYIESLILNKKIQQNQFKLFIGYSGWDSGQLEEELNKNSWIVVPKFDINIIFSNDYNNIWKEVLNNSSKIHKMFSNYPTNPRLN